MKNMIPLYLISLGCPKNLVDSEQALGQCYGHGFALVEDPAQAEVIIVNTCAFIEPAVSESIDVILEMAELKKHGACRELIVAGCLVGRYGAATLKEELPEVDHLVRPEDLESLIAVISPGPAQGPVTRRLSTGPHWAYLKVAEGCDKHCTFCTIPFIRGPQVSRPAEEIVEEAISLADGGVGELILVAQDTTAYGTDKGSRALPDLLRSLGRIPNLPWIRLLYGHPDGVDQALLDVFHEVPTLCPYLDIPIQHISPSVLAAMGRGGQAGPIRHLVEHIRRTLPHVALRTTVMVGFPGEGEAEFQELLDFLDEAAFEHLGVFPYSPEEGTAAAKLTGEATPAVALTRERTVMEAQRKRSRARLRRFKGKTLEVMVDGPSEESPWITAARAAWQAPEIDGLVYLTDNHPPPGTLVRARIHQVGDHDLVGRPVG